MFIIVSLEFRVWLLNSGMLKPNIFFYWTIEFMIGWNSGSRDKAVNYVFVHINYDLWDLTDFERNSTNTELWFVKIILLLEYQSCITDKASFLNIKNLNIFEVSSIYFGLFLLLDRWYILVSSTRCFLSNLGCHHITQNF